MKSIHYILLATLVACSTPARSSSNLKSITHTESKSFSVRPGGNLSVQNMNGRITVSSWDHSKVEIVAEVEASAPETSVAKRLIRETKIHMKQTGNTVEVEAERDEWKLNDRRRLQINYQIRVPEQFNVETNTINGSIAIDNVGGHVESRTINGSLRLQGIRGSFEASSTNGRITADLIKSEGVSDLAARTVNGNITIALPNTMAATVEAQTVNGSVKSDFALSGRRKKRSKQLSADLNGGGRLISLQTVNGGIRIEKQQE